MLAVVAVLLVGVVGRYAGCCAIKESVLTFIVGTGAVLAQIQSLSSTLNNLQSLTDALSGKYVPSFSFSLTRRLSVWLHLCLCLCVLMKRGGPLQSGADSGEAATVQRHRRAGLLLCVLKLAPFTKATTPVQSTLPFPGAIRDLSRDHADLYGGRAQILPAEIRMFSGCSDAQTSADVSNTVSSRRMRCALLGAGAAYVAQDAMRRTAIASEARRSRY